MQVGDIVKYVGKQQGLFGKYATVCSVYSPMGSTSNGMFAYDIIFLKMSGRAISCWEDALTLVATAQQVEGIDVANEMQDEWDNRRRKPKK